MRRRMAPAVMLLLGALVVQPVAALANDPVTISARFATYVSVTPAETGVVAQGRATLPKGFPGADIKVFANTSSGQAFQIRTDIPIGTSPMKDFLTENSTVVDNSNNVFRITGKNTANDAYREVITFDSAIPAGHFAINLADIDAEIVTITITDQDGVATAVEAAFGFQGTYSSVDGSSVDVTANPSSGPTPSVESGKFLLTGPGGNTDSIHSWFIPDTEVKEVVLESARVGGAWGFAYVWMGAIRPTPTIIPTPQVPTTFTIGDDPVAITDDMFDGSFLPGILVEDFTTAPELQFRVIDDGGTGCTLTTNSPLAFTATDSGTCTIECFIAETADYKAATHQFSINVTPTPPPPTPSPATGPRAPATPHQAPNPTGPELAATGATSWPGWAAGMTLLGFTVAAASHFRREHHGEAP